MMFFPIFRPLSAMEIKELAMLTVAPMTIGLSMIETTMRMTELIAFNGRLFVSDHQRR